MELHLLGTMATSAKECEESSKVINLLSDGYLWVSSMLTYM